MISDWAILVVELHVIPRDVLKFPVINNDDPFKFHPTQKPVQMIEYFIKTYSNEGDVVMDNFALGSGSTIIACMNTNRQYIGIEEFSGEYYLKRQPNGSTVTTIGVEMNHS